MFQKLTQKHIKDLSFVFEKKNQKHKRNISFNKYNVFDDYDKIFELKKAMQTNNKLRKLKEKLK
jgi:hypothetical protein